MVEVMLFLLLLLLLHECVTIHIIVDITFVCAFVSSLLALSSSSLLF